MLGHAKNFEYVLETTFRVVIFVEQQRRFSKVQTFLRAIQKTTGEKNFTESSLCLR